MKPLFIRFDRTDHKICVFYNEDTEIKGTIVISDLYLDCVYYTWDVTLTKYFDAWVIPLHYSLMNVIINNNKFGGFNVKLYNEEKRLLQEDKIIINKVSPIITKPLYFPAYDVTGPSYVDFFYGDLCAGMDLSGTVVDAGANVGFFTLLSKEKGAKRVYSIEPDPLPYHYLEKNFSSDTSVVLINKAMSSTSNPVMFDICLKNSVASTISKYNIGQEKYSLLVESITIADILKIEPEINMLKLDIEGAEVEVLESLSNFEKINQLFVEFHDDPKPMVSRIIDNGYHVDYRHSDENSKSGFIYAKKI